MMVKNRRPHHHGDLRSSLILAGVGLIEQGGADALSIRRVAASVGVSHAAPKHHFATLRDLRTAVIAHGFRQFATMMEEDIISAKNTPRARLIGACTGYIRFALANPAMFQLMFGGADIDQDEPGKQAAGVAAYGVLQKVCATVLHGPQGAIQTELMVWSLVHGYASLIISHPGTLPGDRKTYPEFEAIFPDLSFRENVTA